MSHGCKVGRSLRRLEVGEVIRDKDGAFCGVEWSPFSMMIGHRIKYAKCALRPLTPEKAEEWRKKYARKS